MSAYLTIKSILVALGFVGSFGFFFIQARHLIQLMTTAAGPTHISLDPLSERIKIFFTEILLQSRVREKGFPGLAHTLIFFGFIAVLPHTLELVAAGIFPGFSFADLVPGIYALYAFGADILALLTLLGLATPAVAAEQDLLTKPALNERFLILTKSIGMDAANELNLKSRLIDSSKILRFVPVL